MSVCTVNSSDWFSESLGKVLGDGGQTMFWSENWLGSGTLAGRFHRLYNLSWNKYSTVKEVGVWEGGVCQWQLSWRRALQGREVGWYHDLKTVLSGGCLVEGRTDKWVWVPGEEGIYTVNSAYLVLQVPGLEEVNHVFDSIWAAPIPSNVRAFVWRLLLDRIQTRDNLFRRRVILNSEDVGCPLCLSVAESSVHLLLSCQLASGLWQRVLGWLGVSLAFPNSVPSHFSQFSLVGRSIIQRRAEMAIWCATVWTIWLKRNEVVFRNGALDDSNLLDLVQYRSWFWLKHRCGDFCYSIYEWKSNPLVCVSSV
ncbi:uncharacterized protein LOC130720416 isoform X1 [Lotus japonicus]|uniref:uncharacterized protein LOC130720416 isoform X1 n=1 Tax=Lotus japonicus TaxID=34305 RepID=UPI00258A3FC9|nr:uncharacterized protein LOC130720416 isoform X1 [Lotus japonicus]